MKSLKLLMMAAILCLPLFSALAQDAPIEIKDADGLRDIKNHPNVGKNGTNSGFAGNFVLTQDIDFADITDWLPIGAEDKTPGTNDETTVFYGTFDGQGHKLSNIKVNAEDRSFVSALFVKLGTGAVVKNLTLENVDITGGNVTGGVTGTAYSNTNINAAANPVLIQNIYISGKITGHGEVGGIAGRCNNNPSITFANCAVNADITAMDFIDGGQGVAANSSTPALVNVGGIVGSAYNAKSIAITNCLVLRTITAATDKSNGLNPGGLIGLVNQADAVVSLSNSVVAAEITGGSNAFYGASNNPATDASTCLVLDNGLDKQSGNLASLADLQTQSTYAGLDWDFDNVWQMNEGEFPTLKIQGATGIAVTNVEKFWNANGSNNCIEFAAAEPLFLSVYDITGKTLFASQVNGQVSIPASKGIYILKMKSAGKDAVEKIIVY